MSLTQDQTDFVNARAKVVELCQADLTPVLTYSSGNAANDPDTTKDVDEILSRNKRASRWLANTVYKVNDVVMPTTRTGHRFRCVQGGTSGATEPILFTEVSFWIDDVVIGGKLTDGTSDSVLIWKEDGTDYENIYDVRTVVHECWILKASKAAGDNHTISDGRGQAGDYTYLNCLKQADRFAPLGVV